MATYEKIKLSADPKGAGIPLTVSPASGDVIHQTDVSGSILDELWLYASWSPSGTPEPTPVYLALDNANYQIMQNIPANAGLTLIIPGLILSGDDMNSSIVTAYDWLGASGITLYGYVNRITP
jgi:hypothetical protein